MRLLDLPPRSRRWKVTSPFDKVEVNNLLDDVVDATDVPVPEEHDSCIIEARDIAGQDQVVLVGEIERNLLTTPDGEGMNTETKFIDDLAKANVLLAERDGTIARL